ncbi:hypothetical protein C1H76_5364 [Elsinoe australis]|uniref:Uncharacterized protein n=1 Tax=Elsinoe australis TaxID=40998 RepID=A0A4U7AZZ0_9PEZI|nr:hypothetical protein C1H76_5364 [Elsinoe australis]
MAQDSAYPPAAPAAASTQTTNQGNRTFLFDFQWKNFKTLVTDMATPDAPPNYIADFKFFALRPKVYLKSGDGKTTLSTGTLYNVHINADIVLRGQNIKLEAARRLKTHYIYKSTAFAQSAEKPVTMTWNTSCTAREWHFNLLDENQIAVARYSVDWYALKKFAKLEIIGPRGHDEKVVEEVMATAFTLYGCMLFRMNNIFALFGSAFHKKAGNREVDSGDLKKAAEQDYEDARKQDVKPISPPRDSVQGAPGSAAVRQ